MFCKKEKINYLLFKIKLIKKIENFNNQYKRKFIVEGLASLLNIFNKILIRRSIHDLLNYYTKSNVVTNIFIAIENRTILGSLFFCLASIYYPLIWRAADELCLVKYSSYMHSINCGALISYFILSKLTNRYLHSNAISGLLFKWIKKPSPLRAINA